MTQTYYVFRKENWIEISFTTAENDTRLIKNVNGAYSKSALRKRRKKTDLVIGSITWNINQSINQANRSIISLCFIFQEKTT